MNGHGRLEIVDAAGKSTLIAQAPAGVRLVEVLRHAGHPLNTRCGQRGLCDGCVVDLVAGSLRHAANGETAVSAAQPRSLRACEFELADTAHAVIAIPARSSLAYQPRVVVDYRINVSYGHDPLCQWVGLDAPSGPVNLVALADAINRLRPGPPVRFAQGTDLQLTRLRDRGRLNALLEHRGDHRLVSQWSDLTTPIFGAAIDIGTTTVAVLLLDLITGQTVGRAAAFNEQIHLGDDVVTRINYCAGGPANLAQLQSAVARDTVQPLLQAVLRQASAPDDALRCISFAGNTTMLHLLIGVDPTPMGVAPFTPVFLEHRVVPAATVFGPGVFESAVCHLLPGAAAYIGADLTAGMVATGQVYDTGPCLLVDVGTNGEIILKHGDTFMGCATAAGPAFEGAGLSSGIRAGDGAVSHIRIFRQPFHVDFDLIASDAKVKPIGLCGSAYVDFLAEARAAGVLGETGRFNGLNDQAQQHVIDWQGHDLAFCVARGQGNKPVVVSQRDIASLLQAKAAIAAGILTLLEKARLQPRDVATLYLAGGFGAHLNAAAAIACGLLPGFVPSQIQTVGNTALAGAMLALMDAGLLGEISRAGKGLQVVELNLDPGFESRYIDALSLPEISV